ncbi:MAG: AbrB/MazE/SpoVT family DNA-binding domain-containing protein [Candidatus Omnitrophica bacterium]|nr:AbrB/MazE/SpoVT family DNA-binding domain-containing protein [Candidatus Omnitrophota bacterium]
MTLETVGKISRNGHLTIPIKIRRLLHLKDGDVVRIGVNGNQIVVLPGEIVDKDQTYIFNAKNQEEIKQAEKDFRKGDYSSYDSARELRKDVEGD